MKGIFIVLVVIVYIIYISYTNLFDSVIVNYIYVLGIHKYRYIDKKVAIILSFICKQKGINLIFKEYDTYQQIIDECNRYSLDFGIVPEQYYLDSFLTINSKHNTEPTSNNRFIIGLYQSCMYFCSKNIYIEDNINTGTSFKHFSQIHQLKTHFKIGTEHIGSLSFIWLKEILRLYGYISMDFNQRDINQTYSSNVIFYVILDKKSLISKFKSNDIDGIFIIDIQNSRFFEPLTDTKNKTFIHIDLEKTIFDTIFSNKFKKAYFNSTKLLNSKENILYSINISTRTFRNILISNNKIDNNICYKITELILRNNNIILNYITYNIKSHQEHQLFEPIDIIYLNKTLPYHLGSKKLYEEMKFIYYEKDAHKNELEICNS